MANYPQYEYDGSSSSIYRTNGYGGSDPDVDATQRFTADIDLTQKVFAVCELTFDGSGATDDLRVCLYRSLDDSWDGDELEILSLAIDSDGSEDLWTMTLGPDFGPGHYRCGLRSTGSTDTFEVDFNVRFARYEIATG
jgi:hypothetical protein